MQDVRAAPELLAVNLRLPGASAWLGLSVLPDAAGPLVLDPASLDGIADPPVESFRDHAWASLRGLRLAGVRDGGSGVLVLDFGRGDARRSLVLSPADSARGRGARGAQPNLALVHGEALHALRRPSSAESASLLACAQAPVAGLPATDADGALLDAHSAELLARRALAIGRSRATGLARATRAGLAAARRLVGRRQGDAARLGDAARARAVADALAGALHALKRGETSARVALLDGSELVDVPLDPRLSPGQNLARAYTAAARADRGERIAADRLREAEASVVRWSAWHERAAAILERAGGVEPDLETDARAARDWLDDLTELAREVAAASPARRQGRGAPAAAPAARERGRALPDGVREYASRDGLRILVGRTAAANEVVTFRLARGNDVWLHARDAPGPHVLLMLPKGAEVPQESLLDAATLAHVLSKRGAEPRGDVTWCRAKNVRRIKGAAPGKVTLTGERVVGVRVEDDRVARLTRGAPGSEPGAIRPPS